ncbi:MAG: carboxypeptidase-like regulatory domain-containing protein [Ferruginibacter sp.]
MKIIAVIVLLFLSCNVFAQHNFSCFVKDAESKEILQGVSAKIENSNKAISSDANGRIAFNNLAAGNVKITFSIVGYQSKTVSFKIPGGDTVQVIYLQKEEKQEEEVIVTSSRTNSRIEDLPTKVEVLGSEEVGEENGIKPGNIASLLGRCCRHTNTTNICHHRQCRCKDTRLAWKIFANIKRWYAFVWRLQR